MSNLQFDEDNSLTPTKHYSNVTFNSTPQNQEKMGGLIGLLYKTGLAKNKRQANIIMLTTIGVSWIVMIVLIIKFLL
ncbi:MAG: hypothetical protein PHF79_00810 [Candidatus Pacebacteria bacterium]|nr:hypothetical protein [Candidatus Paceibacterota bacterium]